MKLKIKIKLLSDNISMPKIIKKGDWIDLTLAETVHLMPSQAGTLKRKQEQSQTISYRNVISEVTYLPLGVAMELPKGFEALVVSRSSTPKKLGIICANSIGIIDGKLNLF